LLSALAMLGIALIGAGEARAHAALERSDPAAGAVLAEAPSEIRLWFSEPLEAAYTGADLLDGAGAVVPGVSTAIAADDHYLLIITPPHLSNGGYTVAWRSLSSADGHTLQGYFGFSVGDGGDGKPVGAAAVSGGNEGARALSRGLALLGLAAVLAIAPMLLLVIQPAVRDLPDLAELLTPALRRYTVLAANFAVLTSVAALVAQAAVIVPGTSLAGAMVQTLADTRYGQLWIARMLLLLLCIGAVVLALWGRPAWRQPALILGCALAVGAPLPFSLLSHAAAQTIGRETAVTADALHLLAASVWGGGLLFLVFALLPALRSLATMERKAVLRTVIPRFSAVALSAWAILVVSGLYASWLQVGTVAALRETPYGQSLLAKGALLLAILPLAAYHLAIGWRGALNGISRRVALTLVTEALLAVVLLLVVGRLIGLEPAREVMANRSPTELAVPLSFETDEGQREGSLTIAPGAAGPNTFTLEIGGQPVPGEAEGVLRFALMDQPIGAQELRMTRAGANVFTAAGSELALPGAWQIEAIVRQIGAFSWSTTVTIDVGALPPAVAEPNPAPVFDGSGILGLIAVSVGLIALAVAAVSRGVAMPRRAGAAAAGVVAVAVAAAILATARIPIPPAVAEAVQPDAISPVASLSPVAAHQHATPAPAASPPSALAGPGTPVPGDGIIVTLAVNPERAGPVTVSVAIEQDGAPLSDARVAILSESMEMDMGRRETVAEEIRPGQYLAADVPLGMAGAWRLTVRVSPRGEASQVFPFAVTVS
jgi:copper transport protein